MKWKKVYDHLYTTAYGVGYYRLQWSMIDYSWILVIVINPFELNSHNLPSGGFSLLRLGNIDAMTAIGAAQRFLLENQSPEYNIPTEIVE